MCRFLSILVLVLLNASLTTIADEWPEAGDPILQEEDLLIARQVGDHVEYVLTFEKGVPSLQVRGRFHDYSPSGLELRELKGARDEKALQSYYEDFPPQSVSDLEKVLDQLPNPTDLIVDLYSGGGKRTIIEMVLEILREQTRGKLLHTRVPSDGHCFSGCTAFFIAGDIREIYGDATLGFHGATQSFFGQELVVDSSEVVEMMSSWGYPDAFTKTLRDEGVFDQVEGTFYTAQDLEGTGVTQPAETEVSGRSLNVKEKIIFRTKEGREIGVENLFVSTRNDGGLDVRFSIDDGWVLNSKSDWIELSPESLPQIVLHRLATKENLSIDQQLHLFREIHAQSDYKTVGRFKISDGSFHHAQKPKLEDWPELIPLVEKGRWNVQVGEQTVPVNFQRNGEYLMVIGQGGRENTALRPKFKVRSKYKKVKRYHFDPFAIIDRGPEGTDSAWIEVEETTEGNVFTIGGEAHGKSYSYRLY